MERRPNLRTHNRMNRKQIAQEQMLELISCKLKQAISMTSKRIVNDDTLDVASPFRPQKRVNNQKYQHHSKDLTHNDGQIINLVDQKLKSYQNGLMPNKHSNTPQNRVISTPHRIILEEHKVTPSKRQAKWNNFMLTPNFASNSLQYTCGVCRKFFKKIDDFIYHCVQFCGQTDHVDSSHFINLTQNKYSSFTQEEQIQFLKRKQNAIIPILIDEKQIDLPQNSEDHCQSTIQDIRDMTIIAWRDNYIQDYSEQGDQTINSIELRQVVDDKWKIIDYFEMKSKQIKRYSHNLINDWIESDKSYKFEFKVTYMQPCYPYVLMVNPEKDLTGIIKDQESIQRNYKRFFVKHLLDLRQPVNTPSSIYLIVLAQDFYRYLYKTNSIPQEKSKANRKELDLVYLKYLYQNTPYSRQIDKMYPLFKHFIGFLQAMYVYSDIIYTCKLCGYRGITINNNYLKSYGLTTKSGNVCFEYNEHHTTCPLYNNHKGGFYLRLDYRVKIFTELINIKENEGYTFFCPICANFEQQISAEQLVQHMEKQHGNKAFSLNVYRCLSQKAAFIENVFEK